LFDVVNNRLVVTDLSVFFFFFYLTACHQTSPVVRGSKTFLRVFFYNKQNIYYNDTIEKIRRILGKLAYAVRLRQTFLSLGVP
jgi:hypothetical protein